MVKNVKDLTDEELKELRKLFSVYFRERLARTYTHGEDRPSLLVLLASKRYASKKMKAIHTDPQKVTVVKFLGQKPAGFMTGLAGKRRAVLESFYIEHYNPSVERSQTLELYRAFSNILKERGCETLASSPKVQDHEFVNALETLDFDNLMWDNSHARYKRTI